MSRILLLSNSSMANQPYLEWSGKLITEFLKEINIKQILFIPFAGVTISWDEYTKKVQDGLPDFKIEPIHKTADYQASVEQAEAIMIGGGNTFHLLYKLYEFNLLDAIRKMVNGKNGKNIPYVGWSAGSNVAGPDIGSTNDMPIIWPSSDKALNIVPYNLNPHYNEWQPPNFKGETRKDRLNECVLVKKRPIVAYSEGVAIKVIDGVHQIVAPEIDTKCFPDGKDTRCVKVWTTSNSKPQIEEIDLNQNLNKFI